MQTNIQLYYRHCFFVHFCTYSISVFYLVTSMLCRDRLNGEFIRFMTSYLESYHFLIVIPLNYPSYIENEILESYPLTVTLQIFKTLRLGELAVSSNSPIFSVVKLGIVSCNFMYTECLYRLFYRMFAVFVLINPLFVYFTCLTET